MRLPFFRDFSFFSMKFYHYVHCPFCQRVRLFLGFKRLAYESVVLSYADADTPTQLTGKHMLPIIEFDDGVVMNESLDIIREIEMSFAHPIGFIGPVEPHFQWASQIAVGIPRYFDLLLPWYFSHYTAEFERFSSGAEYFKQSKETKRGKSFEELKTEAPQIFEEFVRPELNEIIDRVEEKFFVMGPTFSVADCVLAADLSGLRLVKNIPLPPEIPAYIARVEEMCGVNLLENTDS
jgi:glutaredoxin 2